MADEHALPAEDPAMSDAAVKEKTGRTWREWFSLLDGHGAARLDRRGITRIISGTGISAWWRQVIAVAYEQARNLRETGERVGELGVRATERVGELGIKATRTIHAPVRALRNVVSDAARRSTWFTERLDQLQKALDKRPASEGGSSE